MRFKTELFAHFVYSQKLSYEELLVKEEFFQEALTQILTDAEAQFINFTPLGDTLRVQCVLEAHGESLFQEICEAIAALMDETLEGRLLFVEKELDILAIYCLAQKKWQESIIQVPVAGPIGAKLRKKTIKQ